MTFCLCLVHTTISNEIYQKMESNALTPRRFQRKAESRENWDGERNRELRVQIVIKKCLFAIRLCLLCKSFYLHIFVRDQSDGFAIWYLILFWLGRDMVNKKVLAQFTVLVFVPRLSFYSQLKFGRPARAIRIKVSLFKKYGK